MSPGLLCDLLVRQASLPVVAPFLTAVPCLAAALIVITRSWPENYGNSGDSLLTMYREGVTIILLGDSRILKIGLVQATVESSMFIFVYLWTPTLSAVSNIYNIHLDIRITIPGSVFCASRHNLLDVHDLDNAWLLPLQAPHGLRSVFSPLMTTYNSHPMFQARPRSGCWSLVSSSTCSVTSCPGSRPTRPVSAPSRDRSASSPSSC